MPRPKSGCAKSAAERQRALRERRAAEGEMRRTVEVYPDNSARADALAAARGITWTEAANALMAAAVDMPDPTP